MIGANHMTSFSNHHSNEWSFRKRMTKRKIKLTEEQKRKNDMILARIEAERDRLFEETRALQRQFRRSMKRERSGSNHQATASD
jgi:hypothetical protein